MYIHLDTRRILADETQAYLLYRDLSGGKAEPVKAIDWAAWDIHPFEEESPGVGQVVTGDLVETGGVYRFAVRDKTAEELAAEVEVWREMAECTRRQGLMLLEEAGLYDAVMSIVAGLPRLDQIEFQNAGTFKRLHPLLTAVAAQAGISTEQLDAMFREAMQK